MANDKLLTIGKDIKNFEKYIKITKFADKIQKLLLAAVILYTVVDCISVIKK